MIFDSSHISKTTLNGGKIVVIGGSDLFTGAPLLSVIVASRFVDDVFLATPDRDKDILANTTLFSKLRSIIWVPRNDIQAYIAKSDAVLIGPGMMRFVSESHKDEHGVFNQGTDSSFDKAGQYTRETTRYLLSRFVDKKWVIDAGSLQTMEKEWLPPGCIITPNEVEFSGLFKIAYSNLNVGVVAREFKCVVVGKNNDSVTIVSDGLKTYLLPKDGVVMSRSGIGDVLAGTIVALAVHMPKLDAAATGVYLVQRAARRLFERVGQAFSADDVALEVFLAWKEVTS